MSNKQKEVAALVVQAKTVRAQLSMPNEGVDTDYVLRTFSNLDLLLPMLESFYEDDKAGYFPKAVDDSLMGFLSEFIARAGEHLTDGGSESLPLVVDAADGLYATALQYGLISFGLDPGESKALAAAQLDQLRRLKKAVRATERTAEDLESSVRSAVGKALAWSEAPDDVAGVRAALKTLESEHAARAGEVTQLASTAADMVKGLATTLAEAQARGDELMGLVAKASANAERTNESAASADAGSKAVQQDKATMREELERIAAFAAAIDEHKRAIDETKRQATAGVEEARAAYDEVTSRLRTESEAIVTANRELQAEIKGHLEKAIGASLFAAFDRRKASLSTGRFFWGSLLAVACAAGVALSFALAFEVSKAAGASELSAAFFLKLSAVIPISFLLAFSARQYSNERRYEEEYAFKSTLSVSLEPYRELLSRMRAAGQGDEARFVESLMTEIFANPVRSVMPSGSVKDGLKPSLKLIRDLVAVSKDFDAKKVNDLLELLHGDIRTAGAKTEPPE